MRPANFIAATLALAATLSAAQAAEPVIFAASSLKTALDAVAAAWVAEGHGAPLISYAGSSALARQIEAGAPADLFLSASPEWMDALDAAGLLTPGTRRDLLGNALVLAGHRPGAMALTDLPAKLGDEHLAMALVDAVPAGQYGKAAFTTLGLWEALAPHVAQADNARAALALVASGEAPYGVVFATDAAAEPRVSVAATFPAESHPPITYPVALIAGGLAPAEAQAFLDYLGSKAAKAVFEAQGFTLK